VLIASFSTLQWDQTQLDLKLTMERNTFGVGAPLHTMMERKVIGQVRPPSLPSSLRARFLLKQALPLSLLHRSHLPPSASFSRFPPLIPSHLISQDFSMPGMGISNFHMDILSGNDESLRVDDFYKSQSSSSSSFIICPPSCLDHSLMLSPGLLEHRPRIRR